MTQTTLLEPTVGQAVAIGAAIDVLRLVALGLLALIAQAGFVVLDAGLVRSKNVAHTTAMVLLALCASLLGFWSLGFGLQNGYRGFFFSTSTVGVTLVVAFLARASLSTISAAIPAGAVAERSRLALIVLLSFVGAALIFPMYAQWVWAGGWLSRLRLGHGVVDGAGGGVVHMTGGMVALVAAKMIGPRLGKYNLRGDVRPIPAHSVPLVVLGSLLLSAGWLGLAATFCAHNADGMVAALVVNMLLAAAMGALWAFAHTRFRFGKPDLSMICNGFLAGLVASSAAGPFVGSASALVIGASASLLTLEGALFIERRLHIDDPAGAAAVHGIAGAWGLLAVGLFADGRGGDGWNGVAGPVKGLLAGSGGQLLASLIGIAANVAWVVPTSAVALWLIGRLVGSRVLADDEVAGLDVPELGMTGYVSEATQAGVTRGGDLGYGKIGAGRSAVAVQSQTRSSPGR
jgi:Amt family ammonium transporter